MTARVLIVEDEILTALELEYVLTEQGYEVVGIAQDSASARALAASNPIDLALVDVNLRDGRTGVGLGAELARKCAAKVIYLTAHPLPPHERPQGVVGLLTKPSDEASVVGALDFALGGRGGDLLSPPPALQLFY
ncbi:MAG TPA: response regulator [Caulobacter sp.]|nr:response regulator [Caulobacter sp.]